MKKVAQLKEKLKADANQIIDFAIQSVLPDEAVKKALAGRSFGCGKSSAEGSSAGDIYLVAIGKAAWQMASAAMEILGGGMEFSAAPDEKSETKLCWKTSVKVGIVITKYGHVMGEIPGITCLEAGHPVPDENTFKATRTALELTSDLKEEDTVIFLISGGGSALFEDPLISPEELQDITSQLLACGANINEINTIRKRFSKVKGGRFAEHCSPAKVFSIILSDIVGDPLDMIASGPASPDSSTCQEAIAIAEKYSLNLSESAWKLLEIETPKHLPNSTSIITGSVRELCDAAYKKCAALGYEPKIVSTELQGEARLEGKSFAELAISNRNTVKPLAFIAGGETVVTLTGEGKGGRNQEFALAAAEVLDGLPNALIFSVGSDGTDGPTDAAGGLVTGSTKKDLLSKGISIETILMENDSYNALAEVGGLIITGPTGTNVNDLAVLLVYPI